LEQGTNALHEAFLGVRARVLGFEPIVAEIFRMHNDVPRAGVELTPVSLVVLGPSLWKTRSRARARIRTFALVDLDLNPACPFSGHRPPLGTRSKTFTLATWSHLAGSNAFRGSPHPSPRWGYPRFQRTLADPSSNQISSVIPIPEVGRFLARAEEPRALPKNLPPLRRSRAGLRLTGASRLRLRVHTRDWLKDTQCPL
jgi:hypothetical protein